MLAAAEAAGNGRLLALALEAYGLVAARRGDHEEALRRHGREVDVWNEVGSLTGQATGLLLQAQAAHSTGDLDGAVELSRRAIEGCTASDNPPAAAHALSTLADVARLQGDTTAAEDTYLEARAAFQTNGDRRCLASTNKNLAAIADQRGDHDRAVSLFLDSMRLRQALGDEAGLAECLEGLAGIALATGRPSAAVTLLAASSAVRGPSLAPRLCPKTASRLINSPRGPDSPSSRTNSTRPGRPEPVSTSTTWFPIRSNSGRSSLSARHLSEPTATARVPADRVMESRNLEPGNDRAASGAVAVLVREGDASSLGSGSPWRPDADLISTLHLSARHAILSAYRRRPRSATTGGVSELAPATTGQRRVSTGPQVGAGAEAPAPHRGRRRSSRNPRPHQYCSGSFTDRSCSLPASRSSFASLWPCLPAAVGSESEPAAGQQGSRPPAGAAPRDEAPSPA